MIRGKVHTLEITYCVSPVSLPVSGLALSVHCQGSNVQAVVTLAFLWCPAHLSLVSFLLLGAGTAETPIICMMVIERGVTGSTFI